MNIDVWSLVLDFCGSAQKLRLGGSCEAASLAFGKIISRIEWRTIPYDIHPRLLKDYPTFEATNEHIFQIYLSNKFDMQQFLSSVNLGSIRRARRRGEPRSLIGSWFFFDRHFVNQEFWRRIRLHLVSLMKHANFGRWLRPDDKLIITPSAENWEKQKGEVMALRVSLIFS